MNSTAPKSFTFVLMPFSDEFNDIYQLGIKPACHNAGAYAERVDEQLFKNSILERIYNQISKADIVISDMTGRSPNVFYETGYAHALGKNVILLTQNHKDIPFDLKHYPHIIYESRITKLIPELEKRVRWFVDNPKQRSASYKIIEGYVDGHAISENPEIKALYNQESLKAFFKLDFHNPVGIVYKMQEFQFGIDTPQFVWGCSTATDKYSKEITPLNTVQLANDRLLHLTKKNISIFPGAWDSVHIVLNFSQTADISVGDSMPISLKLFSSDGTYAFSFSLKLSAR
jgi:hypothetical protein